MDSLEQWVLDIGRNIGALEAENKVLHEMIEELKTKDDLHAQIETPAAALEGIKTCHLDALDQSFSSSLEELEIELNNMTHSRDWFRRQYEELLPKPVPHDPLVKAAEDACGCTKHRLTDD